MNVKDNQHGEKVG